MKSEARMIIVHGAMHDNGVCQVCNHQLGDFRAPTNSTGLPNWVACNSPEADIIRVHES